VSLFASASYALLPCGASPQNCSSGLRLIPGITALAAAAAAAHWPLALQQQGCWCENHTGSAEALEALARIQLQTTARKARANLVLLKLGPRWSWVSAAVPAASHAGRRCQLAQRLGIGPI